MGKDDIALITLRLKNKDVGPKERNQVKNDRQHVHGLMLGQQLDDWTGRILWKLTMNNR